MSAGTLIITFEAKFERNLLYLLVACWVAQLGSENVPLRKHERWYFIILVGNSP